MSDRTSRVSSLFVLIWISMLLAAAATGAEINRPNGVICQNSTSTSAAFADAVDLPLRDVTAPGSVEPLSCVICACGADLVYYWGTASCGGGDPTCTEIHDGVARALPEVQLASSMAVPALSVIGAAVLAGGILAGALLNRNRRH